MNILAIGAHIDDVEIGCGGTLARAAAKGHTVKIVSLSDSGYTNYDGKVHRTASTAKKEANAAAKILGVSEYIILDFPTSDIPLSKACVSAINKILDDFKPSLIFTHWPFDTHQDHYRVSLASIAAARYYNNIYMYEPMMPSGRSYVGFRPQAYVNISDFIETKKQSLRAHKSQYAKYGELWFESVVARSKHRGFEMGAQYAECYEVMRSEISL
jgi:LmbE family N-acetylglucosaminyl deacetylase